MVWSYWQSWTIPNSCEQTRLFLDYSGKYLFKSTAPFLNNSYVLETIFLKYWWQKLSHTNGLNLFKLIQTWSILLKLVSSGLSYSNLIRVEHAQTCHNLSQLISAHPVHYNIMWNQHPKSFLGSTTKLYLLDHLLFSKHFHT